MFFCILSFSQYCIRLQFFSIVGCVLKASGTALPYLQKRAGKGDISKLSAENIDKITHAVSCVRAELVGVLCLAV